MSEKLTGFNLVNLTTMIETLGESKVKDILSSFHCPKNTDVESFLRTKSILFANQGLSSTHLVVTPYRQEPVIVGYFTLAQKTIYIEACNISSKMKQRINKFATYDTSTKCYSLSAALIAQLGKNYQNNYNTLITGEELLQLAIDKVKSVQLEIGGRVIYLECEDVESLNSFYDKYGFSDFGERDLDSEERKVMHGGKLKQKLFYLSHTKRP